LWGGKRGGGGVHLCGHTQRKQYEKLVIGGTEFTNKKNGTGKEMTK